MFLMSTSCLRRSPCLTSQNPHPSLGGRYHHLHIRGRKTEAQSTDRSRLPQAWLGEGCNLNPWLSDPRSHTGLPRQG